MTPISVLIKIVFVMLLNPPATSYQPLTGRDSTQQSVLISITTYLLPYLSPHHLNEFPMCSQCSISIASKTENHRVGIFLFPVLYTSK